MEIARDAMGLPPSRYRLDPVLKEISFGAWEGLTWREIEARDPKGVSVRRKDKWDFVPPEAESYAMLAERLRSWLDRLAGDALVVSHGGVARALMTLIAGVAPKRRWTRRSYKAGRCASRTGMSLDRVTVAAPVADPKRMGRLSAKRRCGARSSSPFLAPSRRRRRSGRLHVDRRSRELRQKLVCLDLFLQRLVEQVRGVFEAQLLSPGLERAVAGDFVVFDGLS